MTKVWPVNHTEFEVGQHIYWGGDSANRVWFWGEVLGVFVDELWVLPCLFSHNGQPFQASEPPQGKAVSTVIPARRGKAAPAWKHAIRGPLPHEAT